MRRGGIKPLQCWVMAWLSQSYLINGDLVRARQAALDCLEINSQRPLPFGAGLARRTLGRIALRRNDFANAEQEFTSALDTFLSIEAAFEAGRTRLDLANLENARSKITRDK